MKSAPHSLARRLLLCAGAFALSVGSLAAAPLKVAYSDWPGWTAFAIAQEKGWFKDAGVEVELLWFEYGPSMEAFSAGKVDAVMVTEGAAAVAAVEVASAIGRRRRTTRHSRSLFQPRPHLRSGYRH